MAKFILNRPDDSQTLSRGKIVGTTVKWFLLLMGCAIVLRVVCVAIYMSMGINPMELTTFGGDPSNYMGKASWRTFLTLMIVAPLAEEIMFRLGLSFKRQTVGLWIGLLPVVCAWYLHHCRVWYILAGLVAAGVVLFWLVCRFTTDEHWAGWRQKYIIPAMWISAVGFGLLHFRAFSVREAPQGEPFGGRFPQLIHFFHRISTRYLVFPFRACGYLLHKRLFLVNIPGVSPGIVRQKGILQVEKHAVGPLLLILRVPMDGGEKAHRV